MLEVEDVACPVDDMEKTDCLCSFVQREWREGRENKGSRYESMVYLGVSLMGQYRRRKAVETPTM